MKLARILLAFLLLRMARGLTHVSIWVLPAPKGGVKFAVPPYIASAALCLSNGLSRLLRFSTRLTATRI